MNIFYLDNDPTICSQYHNDKHCIKMILEYAQLLSTAHRVLDGTECVELSKTGRKTKRWKLYSIECDSMLYSATHINHPSAKWARDCGDNYRWLYRLFKELCAEYTHRYGKTHLTEVKLLELLSVSPKNINESKKFTEPTPAMPDEVKIPGDSVASYRSYYIKNKGHLASWKKRNIPEWINANL